ncbi:Structural maintenance of chromosomes protein 4 [Amphibalanus amphitrite]|uniref:Structural maintenance of chromosomes protein 4 n=1 Tax=Amphibalanus amphitrite TaxID=1232801 RepID=A0A6A4VS17_AMPAM|nr:Structural maintenance of chromosomes protein 4 [Amphibalanus amphitrite]
MNVPLRSATRDPPAQGLWLGGCVMPCFLAPGMSHPLLDRTKNAQFIIISLRSQMFELADRLVGIYKTHNATKSVTINPALIGQPAAAPAPAANVAAPAPAPAPAAAAAT